MSSSSEDSEEQGAPSRSKQLSTIQRLREEEPPLKAGAVWYVVSAEWMRRWEAWAEAEEEEEPPGPVDNSALLDPEGQLRRGVLENTDYVIVGAAIWKRLSRWYSCEHEIARRVVQSTYGFSRTVELHLLRVTVVRSSCDEELVGHFSKADKVRTLLNRMCERMGIKASDVQIWDYYQERKFKRLTDIDATLEEERIQDGQKVLFEEKVDGKWPRSSKSAARSAVRVVEPGLAGLDNMGNTCFMNSGLQCLSNTYPLARLFVTGEYAAQINTDNPLGSQGELATEFGNLMQDLWSGCVRSAAPRDFKWRLERVAPQFAGWQQHDSQELIAMLLDGLHEDLNRVKKKPYFESNEFDDLEPEEAARKTWEQNVARDNSHVRDLFMGQLRSTLDCPHCPRISTTYDPLMYLSVPLPQPTHRPIELIVWPAGCTGPPTLRVLQVPLDRSATVEDLKTQLHEECGLPAEPSAIQLCDVYGHRVYKIMEDHSSLSSITDRDKTHVYTSRPVVPEEEAVDADLVDVFVLFKEERTHSYSYGTSSYYGGSSSYASTSTSKSFYLAGNPVLLQLPAATTYGEAMAALREHLAWALEEDEEDAEHKDEQYIELHLCDKMGTVVRDELCAEDDPLLLRRGSTLVLQFNRGVDTLALSDVKAHDEREEAQDEAEGAAAQSSGLSLATCMELYSAKEQLGKDDMWYCNKCTEHVQAYKQVDLWKLPPILVVHLKRFSYKNRFSREKLNTLVQFPLRGLDMAPFLKGPHPGEGQQTIYDLYAVSNHYGALGGGHYTACAKNHNDQKWYRFDDSRVSPIADEKEVVSTAAYVLFYARRGFMPEGKKMPLPPGVLPPGEGDADDDDDDLEDEEEQQISEQDSTDKID